MLFNPTSPNDFDHGIYSYDSRADHIFSKRFPSQYDLQWVGELSADVERYDIQKAFFSIRFISTGTSSNHVVFGTFVSNLLNDKKLKMKGLFRTAIFLPCITSMVSYSLIMKSLFSQSGLVNNCLYRIGLIDDPIGWLTHPVWAKVSDYYFNHLAMDRV